MDRIEDLFRTGKLRAGSRLPPETQLAASLGVSRHTLREVLKSLNLFGILRSHRGDGTYVQHSSSGLLAKAIHLCLLLEEVSFLDLLDTRIAIEPVLAAMAADKAGRNDLELMRREVRGMATSQGDLDRYVGHEIAFHNQIMQAADSPVLRSVLEALAGPLLEARRTVTGARTNRQNVRLHARILEAIEAGDAAAARQRMLDHLMDNRKYYLRFHRRGVRPAPGTAK